MISPKFSLPLACVTLVMAAAIGVDWLAAECLGIGSPGARWWLLAINLGLVGTALAILLDRQRTLQRTALAHLDALASQRTQRLAGSVCVGDAPRGDAWAGTVRRLHERLVELAQEIDTLKQSREQYKQRVERLESQSRRVRSVLSALGEPVLVIDKRDDVVLTNSSAERILALDAQNTQERALQTLVRCQQLVDLLSDTRRRQSPTEQSREIELLGDDGQPHWYRVTARNIPTRPGDSDADGTSQGAVALLHDISDERRLQKQNAELVSAISHEMKTPLAGIKAYVELLADGDAEDDQSQREFLRIIGADAQRLECLVDDLVELARIEADLAGTRREPCAVRPLVESALKAVRPEASEKQIDLKLDPAEAGGCEITVEGDRQMLLQAVTQLLINAVRYTPRGGRVECRVQGTARGVDIEVQDTGVGLSAADCRRVFEKFYRVPAHRGMSAGAGLGLPLARHIVEDVHGGRIDVESTPGQGSMFRIALPAAARHTTGA